MKKFHVHMGVKDLNSSIRFYTALFGEKPIKEKPDYAKWEPKDTHLIFAISTRAKNLGVDHLGMRVNSDEELRLISERLKKEDLGVYSEGETTCCYSKSNKAWVKDPAGIAWEAYQNMEDADIFHETKEAAGDAFCVPAQELTSCCPSKNEGSCC